MRRSLLAVPVVLALGAGGYAIFHGGSNAVTPPGPPHPATVVRTRDGRVIDLADVHAGVAAPPQAAGSAGPIAETARSTSSSAPAASPTNAAAATGSATGSAGTSADVPPVMPAGSVARFEANHGPAGAAKPMPVPVRGTQGLQKHLGAMANCQGPEYATLTGQARVDYAKRCAKAGVTLPP